jgi:hypothetical protein
MALSHYVADVECNLEMWGSMTAPPPPRKRRVAEGDPYYSPRQGGAGRPSGLGAQTLLNSYIVSIATLGHGVIMVSHRAGVKESCGGTATLGHGSIMAYHRAGAREVAEGWSHWGRWRHGQLKGRSK